jgi:exodeoxyribonuclease VII large subunit
MSLHFKQQGTTIILFGNTFPHREAIKALGGRFQGQSKQWHVPFSETVLLRIQALCGPSSELAENFVPESAAPSLATTPTATVGGEHGISLSELLQRCDLAIQARFPDHIWVFGEVQNATRRNDTMYLQLAEAKGAGGTLTVRAVAWSNQMQQLRQKYGAEVVDGLFADGLQVLVRAQVSLFRDRGSVSLTIDDIDPSYTEGSLARARAQLLRELRAKGLDQANQMLPEPLIPTRIGLISAPGSRAQSDFLDQLAQGQYPGTVIFAPAPMQGDGTLTAIPLALERLAEENVDYIVLTRGGGSAADLRWFDQPQIAYAIARCPVPVIAAIGHHDDVSVCEEICFLRQKTPTAAAEEILRQVREFRETLRGLNQRLAQALNQCAAIAHQKLVRFSKDIHFQAQQALRLRREHLQDLFDALAATAKQTADNGKRQLDLLAAKLKGHDPKPWLARGWTQLFSGGKRVVSVSELPVDSEVQGRLLDGTFRARVIATAPAKES